MKAEAPKAAEKPAEVKAEAPKAAEKPAEVKVEVPKTVEKPKLASKRPARKPTGKRKAK